MGKSVTDHAVEVDKIYQGLNTALAKQAEARGRLAMEDENVALWQKDYDEAVAAMLNDHPHLMGKTPEKRPTVTDYPTHDEMVANPGAWDPDPIEVDDENDPRWTAGVPRVDPSDSAPLPPLEFEAHDGEVDD